MRACWQNLFAKCGYALLLTVSGSLALAQDWDPKPSRNIDEGSDKSVLPIVFVHGNSACGESWEHMAQHFQSNGYPATFLNTFDYSTGGGGGGGGGAARGGARGAAGARGARGAAPANQQPAFAEQQRAAQPPARGGARAGGSGNPALDAFIDEVRTRTGHAKVNLVGHSQGTGVSSGYLSNATQAAKVNKYSAVGGGAPASPNGVKYLVVSGKGDNGRGPSANAENGGSVAWMPAWQDHTMMSTSDEAFWEIYTFFNDKKPKTMEIPKEKEPLVGGFIKSYINNVPLKDVKIEVYEVAQETGRRTKDKPLITLTTDEKGYYGPFKAKPGQYYEFAIYEKNLIKSPRHAYREPFNHTDNWVYFRIASNQPGYTASPVDIAPEFLTDKNTVFVVRNLYSAMLPGIVTAKVNGMVINNDKIIQSRGGAAQPTQVAIYLADGDKDGKSSLERITHPAFQRQFVTACDVFIPADEKTSVKFELNGHVLNVPAWKASEAGMVNVIFDDFR